MFGHSVTGQILFYLVQAGAITILFTGGNTSFNGFPFLTASWPRTRSCPALRKRGHRLCSPTGSSC